jgi:protein SCO1/2
MPPRQGLPGMGVLPGRYHRGMPMPILRIDRLRRLLFAATLASLAALPLSGCGRKPQHWDMSNVSGVLADLRLFGMVSADTGKPVSAKDFRGKVAVVYFGYTHCPDVCPLTMSHLASAVSALGPRADDVRILFVSVDPARDTLPILKAYVQAFSPQAVALRGTLPEVVAMTKLYHVAFSYGDKDSHGNYVVNHSAAIYVFDKQGKGILIGSDLTKPEAITHDLRQLLQQ